MQKANICSSSSSPDASDASYHDSPLLKQTPLIQTQIENTKTIISKLHKFQMDMVFPILKNPYLSSNIPDFDPTTNYCIEMNKWSMCYNFSVKVNQDLLALVKSLENSVTDVETKIGTCRWVPRRYPLKKKRRTAVQISRSFRCPYHNCYRSYGSDVSLNLHIKLKHNGGNKTDRQRLAQQICQCEHNGTSLPRIDIVFPPKFLETQRAIFLKNLKIGMNLQNNI